MGWLSTIGDGLAKAATTVSDTLFGSSGSGGNDYVTRQASASMPSKGFFGGVGDFFDKYGNTIQTGAGLAKTGFDIYGGIQESKLMKDYLNKQLNAQERAIAKEEEDKKNANMYMAGGLANSGLTGPVA